MLEMVGTGIENQAFLAIRHVKKARKARLKTTRLMLHFGRAVTQLSPVIMMDAKKCQAKEEEGENPPSMTETMPESLSL